MSPIVTAVVVEMAEAMAVMVVVAVAGAVIIATVDTFVESRAPDHILDPAITTATVLITEAHHH